MPDCPPRISPRIPDQSGWIVPENRKGNRRGDSSGYVRAVIQLATIPIYMGVAPLVGWWLGRWVDRKVGSDWIFQAIGVALGIASAVRETVFLVRRVQRDLDK